MDGRGTLLYRSSVFPEKLARDYQGYPIRISSFEYEPFIMFPEISSGYVTYKAGLEIQLINVILNSLNLTAKFLPPPTKEELWGTPLKNGSWTGMLGEIKLRKSDIVLAGCYYPCHMDIDFECSKIYKFDEERWYVPCAKPISSWTNIFRIFDLPLWIMFFLVYLLVTVLFWLLFKVRYAHNRYRTLNNCMLYLWAIILGFSPPQDIPDKIIIRFIFLLWTFYCMAINLCLPKFPDHIPSRSRT
ncbi:hypothetical protein L9F63_028265 [Diploptera punctata]|uniref:Uncharacterized protein n=1 Tax=Diploptera punctata TaxID=6984 RepID=A0AAD7ZXA0_DIPPU|nr:hypothetical protein L9F63_028265 [Diploptera punctata]